MKSSFNTPQRPQRRSAGFSMVEVAVTIGVAAFIVGTVVMVVPMALSWHRESIETTVMASAVQEMIREIEQTPWKVADQSFRDLSYYDEDPVEQVEEGDTLGKMFYFDFEGTPVDEEKDAVFRVEVDISDVDLEDEPMEAFLQRGADPGQFQSLLKRVTIYVVYAPAGASVDSVKNHPSAKKHSFLINDKGANA